MKNDNVIPLEKPVENEDLLTAMLRQGAKDLISRAVQAVFFKVVVTVFSYSKLPSLLLAQAFPGSRILP